MKAANTAQQPRAITTRVRKPSVFPTRLSLPASPRRALCGLNSQKDSRRTSGDVEKETRMEVDGMLPVDNNDGKLPNPMSVC